MYTILTAMRDSDRGRAGIFPPFSTCADDKKGRLLLFKQYPGLTDKASEPYQSTANKPSLSPPPHTHTQTHTHTHTHTQTPFPRTPVKVGQVLDEDTFRRSVPFLLYFPPALDQYGRPAAGGHGK